MNMSPPNYTQRDVFARREVRPSSSTPVSKRHTPGRKEGLRINDSLATFPGPLDGVDFKQPAVVSGNVKIPFRSQSPPGSSSRGHAACEP